MRQIREFQTERKLRCPNPSYLPPRGRTPQAAEQLAQTSLLNALISSGRTAKAYILLDYIILIYKCQ